MRLSDSLKQVFLDAAQHVFGSSDIVLFGSRVDDTLRGGDFDLAIMKQMSPTEFRQGKVRFFKYLLLNDIDLPIDLVLHASATPLLRSEIEKGVRLEG